MPYGLEKERKGGEDGRRGQRMPSRGHVPTYLVFLDLPVHIEYVVQPMPILDEGISIRFDRVSLRDPTDRRRVREVNGDYVVLHRRLVYSTPSGLLQYLEMSPGVEKSGAR